MVLSGLFLYYGGNRDGIVSGVVAAVLATLIVVAAVFFWHLARAPGEIVAELKGEMATLTAELVELKAPPSFPKSDITFAPVVWEDVPTGYGGTKRLLVFEVEITNREPSSDMVLDLSMHVEHRDHSFDLRPCQLVGYDEQLWGPISVTTASRVVSGKLVYEWIYGYSAIKDVFAFEHSPSQFEPGQDSTLVLTAHDRVSGTSTTRTPSS